MIEDYPKTFRFCSESGLNKYFSKRKQDLISEVEDADPNYLSNVEESEYLEYLGQKYLVKIPELKFDEMKFWDVTRLIPGEWFPPQFPFINRREKHERDVIKYQISFNGDGELFKFKPNESIITYGGNYVDTYIEGNNLCLEIIDYFSDLQKIRSRVDSNIRLMKEEYSRLIEKIQEYNYNLAWQAENAIKTRKNRIVNLVEVLGVPIEKSSNVPEVFSPDENKKQQIVIKPTLDEKKQSPEYVLSNEIYFDILQKIHDIGKNFERYPSTHKGKEEEDLRDFIITFLQPLYKLAVTGETFNKKGKTDILMRYQNTNVFIAECKFWQGKKEFLKGITQLLGYLTWRDSKAAVIIFVKRKDFSSILQNVKSCISEHNNYLNYGDEREETWFNYTFHLNEDKERKVKLSVQLFNLAESK